MYQLTLTSDERKAFDWVGGRYATGDDVAMRLRRLLADGHEWDDSGDIAFSIPEHVAWEISELAASEDSLWPCFADGLTSKMQALCDSIV